DLRHDRDCGVSVPPRESIDRARRFESSVREANRHAAVHRRDNQRLRIQNDLEYLSDDFESVLSRRLGARMGDDFAQRIGQIGRAVRARDIRRRDLRGRLSHSALASDERALAEEAEIANYDGRNDRRNDLYAISRSATRLYVRFDTDVRGAREESQD